MTIRLHFSGHTMTCLCAAFSFLNRGDVANNCTESEQYRLNFCFTMAGLCSFMLIGAKEHYTIDVIIAWVATYAVFKWHENDDIL